MDDSNLDHIRSAKLKRELQNMENLENKKSDSATYIPRQLTPI